LVEVCPWNLLGNSETFNSSPWTISLSTISTNATTAPNGTTTAEKLVEDTNAGLHQVYQEIFASGSIVDQYYTFSCYAKASERNKITFILQTPSVSEATFDLINGTASITGGSGTAGVAIENVGNGWYRCSIYRLNTSTGYIYGNIVLNNGSGTSYTGNGTSGLFIWGAQLNIGSTAKPYFHTTYRLNVPRLTYQNGGGGCPSLLLEKQSTNTITFSEDVASCLNTQVGTTVTNNATTSPDGTASADLVAFTPSSYRLRGQVVAAATTYTMSVFFKNNTFSGTETILFNMSDGVIGGMQASIQPANGTATFSGAAAAWTSVSGKVENYGNGWYRVSVTATSVSGGSGWYEVASILPTKSAYFWGFSLETSSYVTSYIPTTSASATRVADACFKTGISSLIGQTSGTIFWDLQIDILSASTLENILNLDAGSFGNTIYFAFQGTLSKIAVEVYVSGTVQCSFSYTLPSVGRYKIALGYASNDFALYVNGVSRGTDSSGSVPTCSRLQMGNGALGSSDGKVNELVLFPTRLSNSELASLTSL
jgi:hypothetical protein